MGERVKGSTPPVQESVFLLYLCSGGILCCFGGIIWKICLQSMYSERQRSLDGEMAA